MDLTIGDRVVVIPSLTLPTGDTVSNYLLAVEATVSIAEDGVTASITQWVYCNKPSIVFAENYTELNDFTKSRAEEIVEDLLYIDIETQVQMKFLGEKRNAEIQDAPWIE